MSDAISASVFRSVLRDVKREREALQCGAIPASTAAAPNSAISEMHAQLLATLPASELALLQNANALVQRRAVKLVTAQPSLRSFFRVESLSRYQYQQRHGDDTNDYANASVLDLKSQPFDGSIARGPNYYNVLPHYCSCQSFHEHTVVQCPTAMCKHMLAALLADATGQCEHVTITDLDFATMLCAPTAHTSPHNNDTSIASRAAY